MPLLIIFIFALLKAERYSLVLCLLGIDRRLYTLYYTKQKYAFYFYSRIVKDKLKDCTYTYLYHTVTTSCHNCGALAWLLLLVWYELVLVAAADLLFERVCWCCCCAATITPYCGINVIRFDQLLYNNRGCNKIQEEAEEEEEEEEGKEEGSEEK